VPFLAYIHAHEPDPGDGDEPRPWEPNWRLWRWVMAAAVFAFASSYSTGAFEAALIFIAFGLACRAVQEWLPDGDGMREYRQ
jgi:hypothetical protein